MLLLKTDLGIFSKEVLTATVVLNVNYGFVKHRSAGSGTREVRSAVRTPSRGREEIWCSQPCAARSLLFGAPGSSVVSSCPCPCPCLS